MDATPIPIDELRKAKLLATSRLLGDTITLTDDQWRAPSALPGWTRAHLATHIARNADALARVVRAKLQGRTLPMYDSEDAREADIQSGAHRSGLDLQIDLDTSAGALNETFDEVSEGQWDEPVRMRTGADVPLRLLPLARLNEIVLHHIDLQIGFTMAQVDEKSAAWLLSWAVGYMSAVPQMPALILESETGGSWRVGGQGEPATVRGTTGALLCWLTGRGAEVTGAAGITLPAFG